METKKLLSHEVVEDLKDFILNPKGIILLVGENGRGKSYVAMKIYEQLTPFKLPHYDRDLAWFITQADLNMLFTEQNQEFGCSTNLLRQSCSTKLLVIDDLGTRSPSPAFLDFLYAIINKRWDNREFLGTIITSNLNSTRIKTDFGNAIFSRIASGRNYVVIGPDRRFTEIGF